MTVIDDLIEQANGLDTWAQYSLGLGLTALALGIVRFLMKKVILTRRACRVVSVPSLYCLSDSTRKPRLPHLPGDGALQLHGRWQ